MKRWIILVLICSIPLLTSCVEERSGRDPEHEMIEEAYFKCNMCQSLEGGIYGKGPFKKLHSKSSSNCVHTWVRIEKGEFKTLAAMWYGIKWQDEIPWWTHE